MRDGPSGEEDIAPFCEVKTREFHIGELRAGKRAMRQGVGDLDSRSPSIARTGGIPIVGPIRYPTGPKAKGKGNSPAGSGEEEVPGGAVRGGFPPGLFLPPPPLPYPKVPPKRPQRIQNTPVARLTDEEYKVASKGLDFRPIVGGPVEIRI